MEIEREWGKYPGWFFEQKHSTQAKLLGWLQIKLQGGPKAKTENPIPAALRKGHPAHKPNSPKKLKVSDLPSKTAGKGAHHSKS